MSEGLKLTAPQRAAAVDRIDESIALLSGAGCGKTFVLARRFVELLLARAGDEKAMSRLVALTFTEKAAMEMSQRVRRQLADLASRAVGKKRQTLLTWLDELPDARISTIHSFCGSLLRTGAIDAGIDPGFAVCADELLTTRMLSEAVDEAILRAVEEGRADVAELLGRWPFARLCQMVTHLVSRRTSLDLGAWVDSEAVLARWRVSLEAARLNAWRELDEDTTTRALLDELAGMECTSADDKLAPIRDRIVGQAGLILDDESHRTTADFAALEIKIGNVGSNKNWGSAKAVRGRLKKLCEALGGYAIFAGELNDADDQAAKAIATLADLARAATSLHAAEKQSRGLLDFTDLLELTGNLLADKPALRRAIAGQIDQLLIDECQDTDAFQIALLEQLAAGPDGAAPGQADVRAGRLFVVGDAKQSIYRFRGAQVDVFEDLCRRMGRANRENLDTSFRTHGPGVEFINTLFGDLMGADYSPIKAHRQVPTDHPTVEIVLADSTDALPITSAANAAIAQAMVTAQRIAEMIDGAERLVWDRSAQCWRPVKAGDVAVLLARMTNSIIYERQLQQRDIPYYVVSGTGFFKCQEVYDILGALSVIDNPFDDVSLFGTLRSSLFGLDDNILMTLSETLDPPYLPALMAGRAEIVLVRLGPADGRTLASAVDILARLHRAKDAIGIGSLIERLIARTGYEAVLYAQGQGKRMVGNVRQLIDRARQAGGDSVALAEFVAQMSELVMTEARQEQAAVAGQEDDVVKIMTIHKAKGLEFPVVILPDLNAGLSGRGDSLVIRGDLGVTLDLKPRQDDPVDEPDERAVSTAVAASLETGDQQAEDIRKWYVAATRHEDHLVFVGADWRAADGQLRDKGGFLAKMDRSLGLSCVLADGGKFIDYGQGGQSYRAAVKLIEPKAPAATGREVSRGEQMLAHATCASDLARAIVGQAGRAKGKALDLLGPVSVEIGHVPLAVTALADFHHCEMLYRWRHVLRAPQVGDRPRSAPAQGLQGAQLGTLLHRCMELVDFADPQSAESLIARASWEMDLGELPALRGATEELRKMLAIFASHDLGRKLADLPADSVLRELSFVMDAGAARLSGQIDLMYMDADEGNWHIVDYKSDRLNGQDPARHAKRYELQMLTYAAAAAGKLGRAPSEAVLYFLRTGQTHVMELTPHAVAEAGGRIEQIASRLAKAVRTRHFERSGAESCDKCPYGALCC